MPQRSRTDSDDYPERTNRIGASASRQCISNHFGSHVPHEVTGTGLVDVDGTHTQIGELSPPERDSHRLFEADDRNSVEWPHAALHQNERGRPSTCSATYARIRLVEIGATW